MPDTKPESVDTDGPTGTYECFECHHTWTITESTGNTEPWTCPVCKSGKVAQVGE